VPPFELVVAVVNGNAEKRFLSLARRRTGIYLATFQERFGGAHMSYHNDGSYFFRAERIEGPDPPVQMRPPLANFRGLMQVTYFSVGIPQAEFDRLPLLADAGGYDRVVRLDINALRGRLGASIYLMEPAHGGPQPRLPGDLVHTELMDDDAPWIRVDLYAG